MRLAYCAQQQTHVVECLAANLAHFSRNQRNSNHVFGCWTARSQEIDPLARLRFAFLTPFAWYER